jgi:uncharacterized protein YecT (DUF1311 family)
MKMQTFGPSNATSGQHSLRRNVISVGLFFLLSGLMLGSGKLSAKTPPEAPHNDLAACQSYATDWYKQANSDNFESITLGQTGLDEEKYEDKVGSQFISTVLSGYGQLKYKDEKPSPIQFTCLLESDQKAVFFHPSDSQPPDAVKQCWDKFQPGDWGSMQECLTKAQAQAELALGKLEAEAKTQAEKVESRFPDSAAHESLDNSSTQWKAYRDAECARRDAFRAGGNHPDVSRYECLIRKTEERIRDLESEE